ncbi:hypothetical protein COOONC_17132 [Cooperia oncophora]
MDEMAVRYDETAKFLPQDTLENEKASEREHCWQESGMQLGKHGRRWLKNDESYWPYPLPYIEHQTSIEWAWVIWCGVKPLKLVRRTDVQEYLRVMKDIVRSVLLLIQFSIASCITCYECNAVQGQQCRYTAASCQYGFFGCVKLTVYSGGVDKCK